MKWFRYGLLITLLACCLFIALLYLVPFPEQRLHAPEAYRFYDRNKQLIGSIISDDGFYRMHIPLSEVSDLFVQTLLLNEDRYFYQHFGINPLAIARASVTNIRSGRVVSGGSTITMQLARMLERRERTFWAKSIEAFRAVQLEFRYSKEQILSYYLALAPYGGNIEGLESAAFHYFGKPASILSPGEVALLVALPKSPNRYRPDKHPESARQQRDLVLQKMLSAQLITIEQYNRAVAEPIPVNKRRVENTIPHTAWHLKGKYKGRYRFYTTLDDNMQRRANRLLADYVERLPLFGISNASAVIIDNQTREVRAIVGSTDYFNKPNLGANDGSRTPRSPGSTLKPFVYALAMQNGLISEKTILYDIPKNYSGYSPQNYSKTFMGPVTVREALTESLNIVAVELSRELGIGALHKLLREGGITTLDRPPSYYGLPLVLGGVEIKLLDLTNLYTSLANEGDYQPYKLLVDAPELETRAKSASLLSREASWLVTHILTDVERPDFPESWQFARDRPTIAWKTGTSYGHQDAWSIGYTPRYTIGVWVGNFDGRSAQELAGSKVAAPLLFDLFQSIEDFANPRWFNKPANVRSRMVCSVCGRLPNRYCQAQSREYHIAEIKGPANESICDIPQAISIDTRTGKAADDDTPAQFVEQKVFNIWPPEMARFLLQHGLPVRQAPAYQIDRLSSEKYYPPKILTPSENTIHYRRLDKLRAEEHGIKLAAATTNRIRKVHWFLDKQLIHTVDPKIDIIINPLPGNYTLELMDEVGGTDSVPLIVKDFRLQE